MGAYLCYGFCAGCKKLFSFNPHRVPSITINGTREPICIDCIERCNPRRIANGLEPVVPLAGAYEPVDEEEWTDG